MIEVLVTTAILTILIGMGLFMSFDFFRRTLVNDERDMVVSLLLKARSRAMANFHQSPHGVCFDDPNYVLFRGSAYDSGAGTNEPVSAGQGIDLEGMDCGTPSEQVIFSQLSGDSASSSISISQEGNIKIISINDEGLINW